MVASLNARAMLVSLVILLVLGGLWEALNQPPPASKQLTEYELMMGAADQQARVPPPSKVLAHAWNELSNPFYDAGPNDKGIGIQLALQSDHRLCCSSSSGNTTRLRDWHVTVDASGVESVYSSVTANFAIGVDAAGFVCYQRF
jgi:hypothetical protein